MTKLAPERILDYNFSRQVCYYVITINTLMLLICLRIKCGFDHNLVRKDKICLKITYIQNLPSMLELLQFHNLCLT